MKSMIPSESVPSASPTRPGGRPCLKRGNPTAATSHSEFSAASWRLLLPLIAAAALVGCNRDTPTPEVSSTNAPSASGNPLTAPVDYIGAVGAAHKQAGQSTALVSLQQAVQAFQAGEDRLPASLQEIVSEGYLPRLPEVPRGMQFQYNAQSGRVLLVPVTP